ncbi:MAG: nodulation protein NfeD [Deltaproteobacteria bacterium]|nr:nodulation protein NfeD [Deltaproteobacteria bacterium]
MSATAERPSRGWRSAGRQALRALMLAIGLAVTCSSQALAQAAATSVYRAHVEGPITPAVVDYLDGAIVAAHAAGAPALIVMLDTPGGLLESTKAIVKSFLASPLPIIVYVAPGGASATSAGVFLTIAAHVAAMAPGTSIGAAHPVGGQGEDIPGDLGKKVENFTAAFGTAIAERRGRNIAWAEKAVRESVTATESDAVKLAVVDFVAENLADVLAKAGGRKVEVAGDEITLDMTAVIGADGQPRVVDIEMTLRQRVLAVIADPNIAYLLMMAAMLGLYMEFTHPGAVMPGVVGAICLLLALLAGQVLPINLTGLLLLLLGMGCLIGEAMAPSFGVLGLGGIVALALGSLFLYTTDSALQVDRRLIASVVACFGAFLLLVVTVLVRDRRRPAVGGGEGLVGEFGVALTEVHRNGQVRVHGERWNAVSTAPIQSGREVTVESVEGLCVRVRERKEEVQP